jgi:hypothetical protein
MVICAAPAPHHAALRRAPHVRCPSHDEWRRRRGQVGGDTATMSTMRVLSMMSFEEAQEMRLLEWEY